MNKPGILNAQLLLKYGNFWGGNAKDLNSAKEKYKGYSAGEVFRDEELRVTLVEMYDNNHSSELVILKAEK